MTWGEFKAAVEQSGMEENDRIWFIDVQGNEGVNEIKKDLPGLGWRIT